jgi:hypothetical protein
VHQPVSANEVETVVDQVILPTGDDDEPQRPLDRQQLRQLHDHLLILDGRLWVARVDKEQPLLMTRGRSLAAIPNENLQREAGHCEMGWVVGRGSKAALAHLGYIGTFYSELLACIGLQSTLPSLPPHTKHLLEAVSNAAERTRVQYYVRVRGITGPILLIPSPPSTAGPAIQGAPRVQRAHQCQAARRPGQSTLQF